MHCNIVGEVEGVQTIHADQEHAPDMVVVAIVVMVGGPDRKRHGQQA
jgi:hypothetical protein